MAAVLVTAIGQLVDGVDLANKDFATERDVAQRAGAAWFFGSSL